MEVDSLCVWASGMCEIPWRSLDVVKEVVNLDKNLQTSFFLSNESTDNLAKDGFLK